MHGASSPRYPERIAHEEDTRLPTGGREEQRSLRVPALRMRQGRDRVLYAFAVDGKRVAGREMARRASSVRSAMTAPP